MAAERTVIEIELVPDLVVDRVRDANRAGSREPLEPHGDVDAITKDVIAVDDDITQVDPDPQLKAALRRHGVIDGTRGPLHLDGAVERVDDTRKIREHAVACRSDDPPVMRRDQRVDGPAELAKRLMRARFILAGQPAVPDHVRMKDRGELALAGGGFQDTGHQLSSDGASYASVGPIGYVFDAAVNVSHYTRFWKTGEKNGPVLHLGRSVMWAWFRRARSPAALFGFLLVWLAYPAAWGETRLAISGYDPVAYFTDGKPVPGRTEFEHVWHDARWRFASAGHRDLFVGDPNRYAPQYDGHCAWVWRMRRSRSLTRTRASEEAYRRFASYLTHTRYTMGRWQPNLA
jgi:hypothetical protein